MRQSSLRVHERAEQLGVTGTSAQLRATIDGLCVPGVLSIAVQPLVRLSDLGVVGYEALARMNVGPRQPPDWWLERASEIGMRARLEIACWRAVTEYGPPPQDALLFLNVSPAVLAEPDLLDLRERLPEHLVIEVTEQEAVADYIRLRADLAPWLGSKARLAIDDTGSGYSSLRHVIELSPDFLKIDRSLVSSVDVDRNRRALLRSLVAFAREVGCTVIAEGVETQGELETLRDADVDLVQGFLFGRPRRPWTTRESNERHAVSVRNGRRDALIATSFEAEGERLKSKLDLARDATSACEAVVDYLSRRGDFMPSIYLERRGQLRCVAQRGLWQVLDGLSPTAGITGRTWASGQPFVVTDINSSTEYLEAIPGVMGEICVPILSDGRCIGALNVESLRPLPEETLALLVECARLLSERLAVVGWLGHETEWQRAARASVTISGLALEHDATALLLYAMAEAAGIDSAALIQPTHDGSLGVRVAIGPLRDVLADVPQVELQMLSSLVDHISSCYTGSERTGRGFFGTESLRSFARAAVVLPLMSGGERLGTVVLAHSRPRGLTSRDVEPLELLAGHLAATLGASSLIEQLRRQARQDRLTGLGNRAAFEEFLDDASSTGPLRRAAVILDIDHFKSVNDRLGHLTGDQALSAMASHLVERLIGLELFRYGGDEFALLLDELDATDSLQLVRELCVAGGRVLSPFGSSVTAGVAVTEEGESPRQLFKRADEALLWAKQHARGTATISSPAIRLS